MIFMNNKANFDINIINWNNDYTFISNMKVIKIRKT